MSEFKDMNIYAKFNHITNEVGRIPKNLTVGTGKSAYKAVSEGDVLDKISPLEHKYGICSVPVKTEIIKEQITEKQGTDYDGKPKTTMQVFIRVAVTMRFTNTDKPEEFIEVTMLGDGVDSLDKAPGKAVTYAAKYCFLKNYKIETGDDPDSTGSTTPPHPAGNATTPPHPAGNSNSPEKDWIKDKEYDELLKLGTIETIDSALKAYKMKKDFREALGAKLATLKNDKLAHDIVTEKKSEKPTLNAKQMEDYLAMTDVARLEKVISACDLNPTQKLALENRISALKGTDTVKLPI